MTAQLLSKTGRWRVVLLVAAALAPVGIAVYSLQNYQPNSHSHSSSEEASANTLAVTTIAALGRLEPQGEVIHLSAPPTSEGVRVAQLLVKENDRVQPGQVIAIL